MKYQAVIAALLVLTLAACDGPGGFVAGEGAGTPISVRDANRIERRTAGPSAPTLSRLNPDYRQWANDRR
ncbi:hypothetical protein [uncultured Tateyamaria sp.]|uniref:hypothetical protein n=1 Tax=uncultured Tateyamaria sp. TaxID=455651 RepID=UPI00260C58D0|nr:hypothetical protein [uncultured Tateyamaria sp.]